MAEALLYVGRVSEALAHVERAMRLNPICPDFYLWTLGMALYHAGKYEQALAALTKMGNPPNLARRHVIATNVRLGRLAEAKLAAAAFLRNDPTYVLTREMAWPYQDETMREALISDLRRAGLPDKASNENKAPRKPKEGRNG
jgi:adenylate cyclase